MDAQEQGSFLSVDDLAEAAERAERITDVTADGFVFDMNTGEVLGHVDASDDGKTPFRVDSVEAAEWALELRSKTEGTVAGLLTRRAALIAQIDALLAAERRKLAWWDWRFAGELKTFAKANLPKEGKTWRCAWGSVAFRATKGTTAILDDKAALEFVGVWRRDLIQSKEWVTATACKEAIAAAKAACGEDVEVSWLKTTGPGENAEISTGIDIKE